LVRAATLEDQREVSLPVALPEASAAAEAVFDVTDAIEVTPEAPEVAGNQPETAPESTQAPEEPPTPTPEPEPPQNGKEDDTLLERTGTITDIKAGRGKIPGFITIDGTDFSVWDKKIIVEWSGRKGASVYANYRKVIKGDKTYFNLVSIERQA
jgi:hypothetical protein